MTDHEGRTLKNLAERVSRLGSLLHRPDTFTGELQAISKALHRMIPKDPLTPSAFRPTERQPITPGVRYSIKGPVRVEVRKRAA